VLELDILNCPDNYYLIVERQINWGKLSGQGKRAGRTVKGGMGNPPQGVVTYTGISFEKLPDFEEIRCELKTLTANEGARYLKARDYGLNHRQSRMFALGMKYLERELARSANVPTESSQ
jgi:hypothetical protein